ncbi:MAG: ABC transporter permease [Coriobacteriia bacterium]|nr:ABC transporter permease [Coriobacteriia bacterium]
MLPLRIAWRFLRSSPGQSALIIAGIGVGIATQIFVGSIIVSLQANLLETTIGSAAHITVKAIKESDPVRYSPEMQKLFASDPRVKPGTVAPIRSVSVLFSNGTDSSTLGVIGGKLQEIDGIFKLTKRTIEGKASIGPSEIMLGKEFAEKFNISVGDTISLKFSNNQTGSFKVTGIFDLGSAQFNLRNAFVAPAVPQNVLGWANDEFSSVQMQLVQPYDSAQVAAQWSQQLPGVSVLDWQGQNADLLAGLTAQSVSSYMIQAFVLIAIALGIASTLAIAAVQKTRQIGILKAMGLGDRPAGQVFLFQAAILGMGGSLAGVLFSFGLLALFKLSPAPFTIEMQPSFVAVSSLIGIIVALLSSIVPIRSTSRLDPIEVIQSA